MTCAVVVFLLGSWDAAYTNFELISLSDGSAKLAQKHYLATRNKASSLPAGAI